MNAYCLSFHAGYRCHSSGACCTAGWPIPVEPTWTAGLLAPALLRRHGRAIDALAAGSTTVPLRAGGACAFFDDDGTRRCAIHRDAGAAVMPVACRNFPRVTLRDPRGIFVTLSHYCPTAAALLVDAGEIAIVAAPAALSLGGEVEGLDATAVMPPLLRPGMLTDLDGYAAWERACVAAFNAREWSAGCARQVIAAATRDVCGWTPGRESLEARVNDAFARASQRYRGASPPPHPPFDRAVKAFLAAHLFGSWAAYQGGGLIAVLDALASAHELLGVGFEERQAFVEAARAADLRLRHSAQPDHQHVGSRSLPSLRHD